MKNRDYLPNEYLHNMYNATSTDDGKGDIETYEYWLERQLLSRIETLEEMEDKMEKIFVSGYLQRAKASDLPADEVSELYAKALYHKLKAKK